MKIGDKVTLIGSTVIGKITEVHDHEVEVVWNGDKLNPKLEQKVDLILVRK